MAKFQSDLTNEMLINGVSCVAGVQAVFAEKIAKAGEVIGLGFGDGGMDNALGRIVLDLQTAASAKIDGLVRIQVLTPQDIPVATVFESRTENLRMGLTDYKSRMPFNEGQLNCRIGEDYKVQFVIFADATATIDKTKSTLLASSNRHLIR